METTQFPGSIRSSEREAFWKRHLDSYQVSGLSRSQYCRLNNLGYERFGYWIKKLTEVTSAKSSLVAVTIKDSYEPSAQAILCTLNLRGGEQLQVHNLEALSFILGRLG